MNHRFIHQAAALIACVVLVVMLTLTIMNKVDILWFWGTGIVCLGFVYLLKNY